MDAPVLTGEPRLLVDGALVQPASGRTYDNVNPATQEVLGPAGDAGIEDADRAIASARRAFDETDWATDHAFRARCLRQLAEALDGAREEFRRILVAELGTPILLTYNIQLDVPVGWFPYWADLAEGYAYERELPVAEFIGEHHRGIQRREPIGVVGAITAFNFPLYLTLVKLGPALAAGNTVVHKPAPDTPWTGTLLGRLIAEETDIPPGVVNVLPSFGPEIGEALTTDPRVDMVAFTGSTETGRRIMAAAAPTLKKTFLELGGKSANVILDDVDLMTALPLAPAWACSNAGQGCALYTRLLLPRSKYDEGVGFLKMGFENFPVGDPAEPQHLAGPLVSERQRDRVLSMIARAVDDGATLVAGGGRPADLPKGYYVEPTLFTDVDPASELAREEVFGPVMAVIPYDDEDDAVRIANDSIYGLSGSVWSAEEDRALSVARRIRTGSVSVNGGQWVHTSRPFGGYKQSGLGRENGVEGFEEYTEIKVVGLPPTQ
jgi:aldehyde dehydrogenase (NAD+)